MTDGFTLNMFDELPPVAYARRSDPETSHAAAASLPSDRLRQSQAEVLALFRRVGCPLTDTDVRRLADEGEISQSDSGLRTRRRELVDQGLVRDSGIRDILESGRRSIKWEACPAKQ